MKLQIPTWHRSNGEIIACTEKIKVMRENIEELQQYLQDAFEDALLMDVDETQFRQFLLTLVNNLDNPYKDQNV
ncbi:hypothetical protein [Aquella oligotrophica]|uniref:Uncharacterized protein n=1 Tax=Aquella oligotrophica TaxID=2067065 RepID=A0A2I7N8U3_9NEIS|nr:hypothetical protein [Aquella oligotrophica]AUR52883.1 hypothetical protein CUN60_11455 [Aquella oligotrophica]